MHEYVSPCVLFQIHLNLSTDDHGVRYEDHVTDGVPTHYFKSML
jgi:hypothetical protein